ncbi:MAG TPA: TIGR02147 family protein [Polyangiaceae bacterium]|nr:TIGR02147 family protein [Polyangiaceae bacterium]
MPKPTRTPLRCPIDVFRYHDYRAFLSDYYAAKKGRGFSYRAFSQAAGLGAPNYLKLVITGKRNLSPETAQLFARTCGLTGEAAQYFCELVAFNQSGNAEERTAHYQRLGAFRRYRRAHKLELAEAAYHSTWYLPAIRELVLSRHFVEDPEWIAGMLRPAIKALDAERALATLLQLGLLQRDSEGRLVQRAHVVSTGPETSGMHIRNYHKEMIERASACIEQIPAAERDVSSLTMCLGPKALARLKQRLQEFRRELIELCESEVEPSQVLQLNLQLFPLTQDTGPAQRVGNKA